MTSQEQNLSICSRGYNYLRVDPNTIIGGVLVRDFPTLTPARNKRLRVEHSSLITKDMLLRSVKALNTGRETANAVLAKEKDTVLMQYVKTEQFKPDLLAILQPEIQRGLSFVHDYKQINTQISQNINVIIESKYVGTDFESKLHQATRQERAIYESSKMLEEKLAVAKFLMHPDWLARPDGCVKSRFHGLVLKYRMIYAPLFDGKGVTVNMLGQSFNEILANPQAVSVIPHTLIDNAAKYSPRGGKVEISLQDSQGGVEFSVSSFGPQILPGEEESIFLPFVRGKRAVEVQEEGAGYGLYISQMVAKNHLGTSIEVHQDKELVRRMGFWTVFKIKIPLKAKVINVAS